MVYLIWRFDNEWAATSALFSSRDKAEKCVALWSKLHKEIKYRIVEQELDELWEDVNNGLFTYVLAGNKDGVQVISCAYSIKAARGWYKVDKNDENIIKSESPYLLKIIQATSKEEAITLMKRRIYWAKQNRLL